MDKQHWIEIDDQVPEPDTRVLVAASFGRVEIDTWEEQFEQPLGYGGWVSIGYGFSDYSITHWQPLPNHPSKEN